MAERLEDRLVALAIDVEWPDPPAFDRATLLAPRSRWPHRALAIAAAVLVLLAVSVALPGPRQAMADWLGVTGVRVILGGDPGLPDELGREWRLGRPVTPAVAQASVDFELGQPDELGPPAEVWLRGAEVSFVWRVGGVPVLLTQFRGGGMGDMAIKKLASDSTRVRGVDVDGRPGLRIDGTEHVLRDAGGTRLAGDTLLWERGGITFRLETALPLDRVLGIAAGV